MTGKTLPLDFRKKQLQKLYDAVRRHEKEIAEALYADLGKSEYESYMCETGLLLSEITYMKKHLRRFMKKRKVRTPLSQCVAKSFTVSVPYGNTLIVSPWNYPILLTLEPLADAIAAGNTAVLKPSAYSAASSCVLEKIISECFPPEYVSVVTGSRAENEFLFSQKFDFIFFTGSPSVGKEVLRRAADNLTPVVLELGGKSPCIIDSSADISVAARRIVFGKFLNSGQTCVAPDYCLCDESIKDEFLKALTDELRKRFGDAYLPDCGKIINEKHFDRILSLIDNDKIVYGGKYDRATLRISPTVTANVTRDDNVMKEEIFGPVLPVLTFSDFDAMTAELKALPKPLALYLFSNDKEHIRYVETALSYGGGCINDVVIHLATSFMGFGGVGESGMGSYHGEDGFNAFSHKKSIVDKKTFPDFPVRYRPYKKGFSEKLLHLLLK